MAVHSLVVELRESLHEAGHSAFWVRSDGVAVHGPMNKAPLHTVIEVACRAYYEAMHDGRAAKSQAVDEARAAYLKTLEG